MANNKKTRKYIFVSYIYSRRCYNNPSMDQFASLPAREQERLWEKMEKKHPRSTPLTLVKKMQNTAKGVH